MQNSSYNVMLHACKVYCIDTHSYKKGDSHTATKFMVMLLKKYLKCYTLFCNVS